MGQAGLKLEVCADVQGDARGARGGAKQKRLFVTLVLPLAALCLPDDNRILNRGPILTAIFHTREDSGNLGAPWPYQGSCGVRACHSLCVLLS